jgi:hypothetical protein
MAKVSELSAWERILGAQASACRGNAGVLPAMAIPVRFHVFLNCYESLSPTAIAAE